MAFSFKGFIVLLAIDVFMFASNVKCVKNLRAVEKRILDRIIGDGQYDSRIRPSGMNTTASS
ncbi:glutamate gated chloride channel GluCl2-like protein, partial [Leptotrombidium deliense]